MSNLWPSGKDNDLCICNDLPNANCPIHVMKLTLEPNPTDLDSSIHDLWFEKMPNPALWPIEVFTADLKAIIAREVLTELQFARAAVIAAPVMIHGQRIGNWHGGMPHVLDRQIGMQEAGEKQLPIYSNTYALRDFAVSKIDEHIAQLKAEAAQKGETDGKG